MASALTLFVHPMDGCSWMNVVSRIPRIWPVITICVFSLFFPFKPAQTNTFCLVFRVNFQLMCPVATGIGTVHIKFDDVNICIWYRCVHIMNTVSQFCRIWAGIKALSCDEILPFFVLCETVLLFIHTIFTVPYQNIKIKIHKTIILPVLCLCENC